MLRLKRLHPATAVEQLHPRAPGDLRRRVRGLHPSPGTALAGSLLRSEALHPRFCERVCRSHGDDRGVGPSL